MIYTSKTVDFKGGHVVIPKPKRIYGRRECEKRTRGN